MTAVRQLLIFPIRAYKRCISPLLPPSCRFYPSCSTYAIQSIELHGPVKGLWLAAKRILRCHPGSAGGFDPVPPPNPSHRSVSGQEHQDSHG